MVTVTQETSLGDNDPLFQVSQEYMYMCVRRGWSSLVIRLQPGYTVVARAEGLQHDSALLQEDCGTMQ